jgi:hypothetical protein|tara:strand:+ start:23741 stop:24766 length:1026 start_codon:yes stop_codon:yes gene_type:complete
MAIQIRGSQIASAAITATQMNLTGVFDFSSGTLRSGSPSGSTDVANKAYVDSRVPDEFSGGDGIVITDASPDVIAVDLATNPGLQFTSNKLDLKLDGATLAKASGGLSVAAQGIADAQINNSAAIAISKLAASTISGKALGTNLDALAAGQGLALASAYNGSAGQTMDLQLDGSTLAKGGSGVKVADDGITATQIADNAVVAAGIQNGAVAEAKLADNAVASAKIAANAVITAKIADNAVTAAKVPNNSLGSAKLTLTSEWVSLTPNGSLTAFDLGHTLSSDFGFVVVARNGLILEQKASSPSGTDEYSISLNGGTGGVGQITFGAAIPNGENLRVFYIQG